MHKKVCKLFVFCVANVIHLFLSKRQKCNHFSMLIMTPAFGLISCRRICTPQVIPLPRIWYFGEATIGHYWQASGNTRQSRGGGDVSGTDVVQMDSVGMVLPESECNRLVATPPATVLGTSVNQTVYHLCPFQPIKLHHNPKLARLPCRYIYSAWDYSTYMFLNIYICVYFKPYLPRCWDTQ